MDASASGRDLGELFHRAGDGWAGSCANRAKPLPGEAPNDPRDDQGRDRVADVEM